ncbi:MAG: NAD(P)H-dependent oxidoreductase [Syntrophobacteraceae bacterium]|jgi:multimeric flavodoxin WrbA
MKVVCLLGSPRAKGNSAAIANRFCTTAEKLGAEVQAFALNKLEYRGCQGPVWRVRPSSITVLLKTI